MKRILNFPTLMLLFVAALFMTSCEDEPGGGTGGGGTTDTNPVLSLTSLSELTLSPTEEFTISIAADKGTNEMNAVTVYEDGVKVPTDRLKFNGTDAAANPALLFGTDRESLDWTVSVIAQATAGTSSNFEVEVADASGLTSSVTVTVTTASTPPTLVGAAPMVFEITEGSKNGFKLTGTKGSGLLSSIEVRQNDMPVDAAEIEWDGASMMGMGNPFALTGTEVDGFENVSLFVTLPSEVGVYVYTFILTDEFDLKDTTSYTVTTTTSGTPIDIREDVLLNSAGPSGTGGLDLDNGMSTGSGSADAEIRDNGINGSSAAINWIQTISPVNGSTIKYAIANAGLPENFSFGAVETKEELSGIYDNSTSDVIGAGDSTLKAEVGDTYIVKNGDKYWLLVVKEVNIKTAMGDNSDNYVFDVKY